MNANSGPPRSLTKKRRTNNRLDPLLDAAARQFADKGYRATTTRDISAAAHMQSGSVYYHFKSKGALLLAVYEAGVDRISQHVRQAIAGRVDPLDRLTTALEAHLDVLLDETAYARVITTVRPADVPEFEGRIVACRDAYEAIFIELMDALDFAPAADPQILRMLLIGAANSTQGWYRPGRVDPAQLAQQLTLLLTGALRLEGDREDQPS